MENSEEYMEGQLSAMFAAILVLIRTHPDRGSMSHEMKDILEGVKMTKAFKARSLATQSGFESIVDDIYHYLSDTSGKQSRP